MSSKQKHEGEQQEELQIDPIQALALVTREKVLKRDQLRCIICKRKGVHVHEIIPRSHFGSESYLDGFSVKNRVCLCPKHHERVHTEAWRRKLIKILAEEYGYEYTEEFYRKYRE